ncbi:GPW/gp25 family protein [Micromonospora sp. WMMD714]|uniref:GPW/gp25 family protein n=1 Tax=Micromonospora sp. WMMD714 TaxID=3016097 RepID=UPI00249B18B8|nr:GPW/gp25 family protein [Micromonospora sp. WMMD714]WFE63786.1 GPW/gp25 family protein [Micromonospora sp. WMMD714]
MQADVIGTGCAFPLRVQPNGRLAMISGTALLEQAMCVILATYPGERPMRPEFGSRLRDFVFEPVTGQTRRAVAVEVRAALERWETRAEIDDVTVTEDPTGGAGLLHIEVRYRVRDTDEPGVLGLNLQTLPGDRELTGTGVLG